MIKRMASLEDDLNVAESSQSEQYEPAFDASTLRQMENDMKSL